ncbi:MAG: (Fe-S)-binding protein [Candidatus Binatales bacterium]
MARAAAAADGPSVLVHPGCVAQVLADSANRNSEAALTAAGYQVVRASQTVCCGALDLHSGNRERALRFARANVRALSESGATAIVSTGSGCSVAMAEYGDLLKDDLALAVAAREVSARVTDLSSLILKTPLPAAGSLNCTVTYHDACHLAHGLGVRESPRKLLRSIPGVRLVELAECDLCCGSAGSYNLTEPEMARALGERKVDNIIATGADYVVMANVGCQFQIAAELRRRHAKTRAIHLADFLALATRRQPSG